MKGASAQRSPRKVAHVVLNFQMGGLENLVALLVPQLMTLNLDCALFCIDDIDDDYHRATVSRLRSRGIPVTLLRKGRGIDVRLIGRLRKLLRGFDIVHSHNITAHVYGGTAARLAGVSAILATRHGVMLERSLRFWLRATEPLTNMLICVAEGVANRMIEVGIPKRKVCVVPNGIDLNLYDIPRWRRDRARKRVARVLELPADGILLGAVGRIAPEKGLPTLLEAFRNICELRDDVCLLIIGDGPLRGDLEQYVVAHNMQKRVHFLGRRRRVTLWITILDLLVLPSYSEGLPMVILEAFAAGVPAVASDVGGTGEIVEDGTNGILVQPRDVLQLERALCSLIEDPGRRREYGRNARETAQKRYSIDRIAEMHAEVYSRLLNRSAGT